MKRAKDADDEAESSNQPANDTVPAENRDTARADTKLIDISNLSEDVLLDSMTRRLKSQRRREAESNCAAEIAAQSPPLSQKYSGRLSITVETTEELQTLQETVGIEEETIREMQADAGLQRLHPSRRKEFIADVLHDRIKDQAEDRLDSDTIRTDAETQLATLFDQDGGEVRITWVQRDDGSFSRRGRAEPDMTATISNATTDTSDSALKSNSLDVLVVGEEAEVTVTSPIAERKFSLPRGGYEFSARSLRTLAENAGLIDVATRDATCTSSDKDALDVTVDDTDDAATVTELSSGSNGYSSRYTKGWTEYLDFDPAQEMVLIRLGQASYYNNSIRGRTERTWLVGRDDGQVWAHQVYNSHDTIEAALEFMVPAEVQRLANDGRQVIRQGDVYFVEMIRASNFDAIEDTRHTVDRIDDDTVVITHPEHDDLELTGAWKAILNNDGSQSHSNFSPRDSTPRD